MKTKPCQSCETAKPLADYREYDRVRDKREERRAAKMAYAATPEGRRAMNQSKRQWRERNRVKRDTAKRAVHIHVLRAMKGD